MNARLQHLIVEAEARLGAEDQERLADIVEAYVANHKGATVFSPEEQALLREIDAEPFEAADPDEVGQFFRERG